MTSLKIVVFNKDSNFLKLIYCNLLSELLGKFFFLTWKIARVLIDNHALILKQLMFREDGDSLIGDL